MKVGSVDRSLEATQRRLDKLGAHAAGLPPAQAAELRAVCAELAQLAGGLHQREHATANDPDAAEQALQEILESIGDAFYAVDAAWSITYLNQRAAQVAQQVAGLAPEMVIGRNLWELVPWMLGTAFHRINLQAQAERRRADFEWFSPKLQRWLEFNVCPNASGGLSVFCRDITERRRASEAVRLLAEAGATLAGSLDYSTTLAQLSQLLVPTLADVCIIDVLDESGYPRRVEVAFADPSRAALAGDIRLAVEADWAAPHAEVVRRGESILIPDFEDTVREYMAESGTRREIARAARVWSMIVVPMSVRDDTIGAITLCTTDSDRRYDGRDLELAQELARRAASAVDNARLYRDARAGVEARDAFLSIASHELKTPLTSLVGYAHVLEKADPSVPGSAERSRRAIDVIKRQSWRLNDLIDNMLDLSRLQQGQFTVTRAPADLAGVLRRAIEESRLTLNNHRLTLTGADEPLPIDGDEVRLEQVFHNLVGNAIKYSPRGGQVNVVVTPGDGDVRVAVTDRGIGIPAEALTRLFTPFFRAANVGDGSSGFGIGLYIVKEIVERHDGTISVTSKPGVGSTFVVTLPLAAML